MRIYIARHGETDWNKVPRWQGNQDVPLNAAGAAQAANLAAKLLIKLAAKFAPASDPLRIYTSPLVRAADTARIISEGISERAGAEVVRREGLREIRLGEWEGLTTEEIAARYGADNFREWEENPAAQVGFGVENLEGFQRRARSEFDELAARETEDFLIVTHGAWIRCLVCGLLDVPLRSARNFDIGNAGLSIVEAAPPRFKVVTLNEL